MTFSLAYFYCGFHFFFSLYLKEFCRTYKTMVLQLLLHSPVRNLSGFTVVVWKSQLLGHASTTTVYTMRKGFRQDLCMWIFTQAAGKANGFSISAQFLHLTLLIYLRKRQQHSESWNYLQYILILHLMQKHIQLSTPCKLRKYTISNLHLLQLRDGLPAGTDIRSVSGHSSK